MKTKTIYKFCKITLSVSFIIFIALYFSLNAGYYEYKNKQKTILTETQIKKFEEDVKNGKNIDLKTYIDETDKSYQNKISKAGLSFSNATEKCTNKIINTSFKVLSKLVGDN